MASTDQFYFPTTHSNIINTQRYRVKLGFLVTELSLLLIAPARVANISSLISFTSKLADSNCEPITSTCSLRGPWVVLSGVDKKPP